MPPSHLWSSLPLGYLLSVLIETPILVVGLSWRHRLADRVIAGLWLTACTYPIVILVLPSLMLPEGYSQRDYRLYLVVAETFAPLAECVLFWLAYGSRTERWRRSMWRDFAAIVVSNLASFGLGSLLLA